MRSSSISLIKEIPPPYSLYLENELQSLRRG